MVELTEINDAEEQQFLHEEKPAVPVESEEEFSSDDEDDFDENETLYERFVALKDIVPPQQREILSTVSSGVSSLTRATFSKGGNLLWILTTSALLLGVPLSLSILAEQQLMEMEKEFNLQKDANDILAGEAKVAI